MRRIAPLVLASVLLAPAGASAATIVVRNTNDAGPGSLRDAILEANNRGGADVITFDIPGTGPFVITVLSPLPVFDARGGVTVDGTTQPGYSLRPLIGTGGTVGVDRLALPQLRSPIVQVFGNGLAGTGLVFTANDSTLRGLHVWGFTGINVAFTNANDAQVLENLIGATPAFGDPGPSLRAGVNLLLDGGNTPSVRNNLVGYASGPENVLVSDHGGKILVEENELVGSLRVSSAAPVGSSLTTPNRFISGNLIRDSVSYGVDLIGQSQLTISNNTVRNNGSGGANPAGIRLTNTATDTSRSNVLVRNIVTGNQGPGILVTGNQVDSNRGNTITLNSIFQNGGIGIDLGGIASDPLTGDGATLNDPEDGDDGGNALDNFPVIESATISGNSLIVSGWARNRAMMEFFADPPGSQGRTFIGSAGEGTPQDSDFGTGPYGPGPINGISQGADITERFRVTFPLPPGLQAGSVVVATATDRSGVANTSEFGGPAPITFAADVRITKTGPAIVTPGTTIAYTLVVTNDGPTDASGVSVADVTPTGLTFVSTTGACTTPFPCALGTLASGQSAAITATFAVPAFYAVPNPIVNTATVISEANDPNASNNSATTSTLVGPRRADLAITKGRPVRRSVGANLEYTIVVTNHGPSDVTNATVVDPTPAGLTFISNAGACTTAFPCDLGSIPAGQSRQITTIFLVPSGYTGPDPIVNTAAVNGTATDPDLANNAATATTAVGPLFTVNVEISKAGPANVTPGHTLVYSIAVTNTGSLDATDVTVTDPTPPGLTFVSNAGACTTPFPCALGIVPAGQSRQITTTFAVPPGYAGPNPISNTSTVTTTVADQDPTDNQATVTTPVNPVADLSIGKVGPASLTAGENVSYTILVRNHGPSDATGVIVSDPTPAGLTFVANTGDCTTVFPCALATMPAGQTRTIVSTFLVPTAYAAASILNTASVTTAVVDGDSSNNSASVTTAVMAPSADLSIAKTGPASVTPGTTFSYTLVVTNTGPNEAAGVSVVDVTPPGLTFVSATGACTTPFPCALGTLASGQSAAIVATFAVPAGYTTPNPIVNTASVSSQTNDPNPTNNAATSTTPIGPPRADLAITKSRPVRRSLGADLSYTIVVTNHGPSDAPDATVTDPTPVGLTFISNTGACTTAFPCALGPIPAGQSRMITATFLVPSGYTGPDPIVNTATASSTSTDPDLANNSATATTAIGPLFTINVEISKAGPAGITPGHNLLYSIDVSNTGTLDATDVTVTDPTPAGLTFVSNAGACTAPFPCALGTVPAGQSRQITTTFLVPPGYAGLNPILNTSTVTTTVADQDPTDNQANATTPVNAATADLSIGKLGPASVTAGENVSYTISVRNNGPSNAPGVNVSDPTPSGLTFVGNTGDCTTTFPCALGTIPAGQTRTIVSTFLVPTAYGAASILNTASVTTTVADGDSSNNSASVTTAVVPPSADLSIATTGPASVTPGTSLSYALVVTNTGPNEAAVVSVADVTPPGLTFVSTTGACTTPFPCALGTLASGQSAAIVATFMVPAGYTTPNPIVNTASVSSQTNDPNATNNSATSTTPLGPLRADLAITKGRPVRRGLGANLDYTIVVTNHGPSDAPDATVVDPTPGGLTFISNSGACTTPFPCALGPIPAGQVRLITTTFFVPSGYTGPDPVVNTATVSTTGTDPDLTNNAATATTAVGPLFTINVDISKAGPASITPGNDLVYAITVSNTGTLNATDVTVADPTPAGLTFVSNAGACTTPFPCALGIVPAGQSRQISTTFAVPPGYAGPNPISNTSTVTTTVADQDLTDNQATVTTPVGVPATDLTISQTGPGTVTPGANLTYTIVVGSTGPSDALGVTVFDPTPGGLTFVGNTGGCTTPFPCTIDTIPAGQTRTIQTTFAIPEDYLGPTFIVNRASIATIATTSDPDPGNNISSVTTAVIATEANLGITKTGEAGARPGETISHVLTIANAGPEAAQGVTVSDPAPAGLTFVSNTGDCTTAFPCSLGTLASGHTRTITATFSVSPTVAPGTIVNTATVSASTADPVPADNTAEFSTAVSDITPAVADLALTKTASADTVAPGGAITYVIVATNLGPEKAGNVSISDAIPTGIAFVSASPSPGGACLSPRVATGGSVTCDWPEATPVGAEGERSVRIVVRVPAGTPEGTTILNTASVTTTSIDSIIGNNSASAVTTVFSGLLTSADIEVLKTLAGGSNQVVLGQPFHFQLQVVNHGPADATSIVVTDVLPAGLQAVSANAGQGSFDLPTGVWTVGDLSLGGIATLDLTVLATQLGVQQNQLVRTTSQPIDPNAANDTSVVSFEVVPPPTADMSLVMTGPPTVAPGGTLTYTIVATNAGPSEATAVIVNDPTPAGLTFVLNAGDCVTPFPCALGTMPAGTTRTIIATFTVPHSTVVPGSISNTVSVTTSATDSVPANNTATATTEIRRTRVGCDVNGDGFDDIVTGAGPGGGPHVNVWTLATGAVTNLASFYAYDPNFGGGAFVGCADLDGDGLGDVVTGAGPGGGPHVRAFSLATGHPVEMASFYAYDPAFGGGVRVAVADVDGDGRAEIITGAGPGGGPHVRVFRLVGGTPVEIASFYAYAPAFTGGVFVAAGDVTGDGRASIITGTYQSGGPVRVFTLGPGGLIERAHFSAYFSEFQGAVRVAAADINGDGVDEIITGAGPGGGPHVHAYGILHGVLTDFASFYAYDPLYCDIGVVDPDPVVCDGVYVAGGDVNGDGVAEVITGTNRQGGPLRIFRIGAGVTELASFYPYFEAFRGPVYVAAVTPGRAREPFDRSGPSSDFTLSMNVDGRQMETDAGSARVVFSSHQVDGRARSPP